MKRAILLLGLGAAALAAATCATAPSPMAKAPATVKGLKNAASFAAMEDDTARGRALFTELGRVLTHPRCVNCHPDGERPLQGAGAPHQPLVVRGEDNHGAPGQRCKTCHGPANFENVPGHPHWHLAPASMAWVGKSLAEICAQLKDTDRNGGKSMDELHHHMAEDTLVGYGWRPPAHLEPAPGDQATAAGLFAAWTEAGAPCPE